MTQAQDYDFSLEIIRELFGQGAVSYVTNKHQGGTNSGKGTTYEDYFAVTQIALHAQRLVIDGSDATWKAQCVGKFIDDVVITDSGGVSFQACYQLKNAVVVNWGCGPKSLADDFMKQHALSCAEGFEEIRLGLVVSDTGIEERLRRTCPPELAEVHVEFFPWEEKALRLCDRWRGFVTPLEWLSKHEYPNAQQIAEVLQILLGKWVGVGRTGTTRSLIEAARSMSPTLIRPLVSDEEVENALRPEFKIVLASVECFSYSIVKGFLAWTISYPGGALTRGVYHHDCLSRAFESLQATVIRTPPATADELERELSS